MIEGFLNWLCGILFFILIAGLWAFAVFTVGERKKNALWFYLMINIGFTVSMIPLTLGVIMSMFAGFKMVLFMLIPLAMLALYQWGYSVSLSEIARKRKLGKFYVIYFIPFAWIWYQIFK